MNLGMIDETSWKVFEVQFPAAMSFLLDASLRGEYRRLKWASRLNSWEAKRLTELEALFG